jgi:hypothetical protein
VGRINIPAAAMESMKTNNGCSEHPNPAAKSKLNIREGGLR